MKTLLLIAVFLLPLPAGADVDMYVEHGEGRVYLAGRCTRDRINWCACAVADEAAVQRADDATLCWKIDGHRIIFTGDSIQFEKRMEELKIDATDPAPRVPASGVVEGSG